MRSKDLFPGSADCPVVTFLETSVEISLGPGLTVGVISLVDCWSSFCLAILFRFSSFTLYPHLALASSEITGVPRSLAMLPFTRTRGSNQCISYSLEPCSLMDHAWCFYFYFGEAWVSYKAKTSVAGHQWWLNPTFSKSCFIKAC